MSTVSLTELRDLRLRPRDNPRRYAVPLLVFGLLALGAVLTYAAPAPIEVPPGAPPVEYHVLDPGPFPNLGYGLGQEVANPLLVNWYWMLAIIGGVVFTGWWYRRQASRDGVEIDTSALVVGTVAALAGFLLGTPFLQVLDSNYALYSTPSVGVPLMVGLAVGSAAVLWWSTRAGRPRWLRAVGLFLGSALGALAVATLGTYLIFGYTAVVVIALALLVLATVERSWLLTVVGLAVGAVYLLMHYVVIGPGRVDDGRLDALQELAPVAGVLLLGGGLALLLRRKASA